MDDNHFFRCFTLSKASWLIPIAIFIILLSLFYGGFFNTRNLDFADMGIFPYFPSLYSNYFLYDWVQSGLGGQGSALVSFLFISALAKTFVNPGIAEKIWIMSVFAVAGAGGYFLSKKLTGSKFLAVLFMCMFSFNPVTSGLIYEGSINDTMSGYAFMIPLILVMILMYERDYKNTIFQSVLFGLILSYAYYWDGEILVWILPIFLFYSLLTLALKRNRKNCLLGFLISNFTWILLTRFFSTLMGVISGHVGEIVKTHIGLTTTSQIVEDMSDNFSGQLSFSYWYVILVVTIVLGVIFVASVKKTHIRDYRIIIFYSITLEMMLLLFTWGAFGFKSISLEYFIARYVPYFATFEPFLAITLAFELILVEFVIVISTLKPFPRHKVSSTKAQKKFSSTSSVINRLKVVDLRKAIVLGVFILLLFPNISYWQQSSVPSTIGMISQSQNVNADYAVPSEIRTIADFLYSHTNIHQYYKYLLFPYAPLTAESLSYSIPWTSEIELNGSYWNYGISQSQGANISRYFVNSIALSGVEFLIVYFGPYIHNDPPSSYTGTPRFVGQGFPWDITYVPYGYPSSWSQLFNNSPYFSFMAKVGNSLVYKDNSYVGDVYAYNVTAIDVSKTFFDPAIGSPLLYYAPPTYLTNLSAFGTVFKYNWTIVKINGSTVYEGGNLPSNMSYTNIWTDTSYLRRNATYEASFDLSGHSVKSAYLYIRFFTSESYTGKLISQQGTPQYNGNLTNIPVDLIFTTPENFTSSVLDIAYVRGSPEMKVTFSNLSISEIMTIKPEKVNYEFVNPTKAYIFNNFRGTYMIVFAQSYNSGWEINGTKSSLVYNGYFLENYFVLNKTSTNVMLFEPQKSYSMSLLLLGTEWIILLAFEIAVSIWWFRRSEKSVI